jgi:hypothetical protein
MKVRRRTVTVSLIIFGLVGLFGCGQKPGLTTEQVNLYKDAVQTLRKIEASTQIGVNAQQYSTLVIDAKAKVNDALRVLPLGDLRNKLSETMDTYTDVMVFWRCKFDDSCHQYELPIWQEPWKSLVEKYRIPTETFWYNNNPYQSLKVDNAIPVMFNRASQSLLDADRLYAVIPGIPH